MTNTSKLGFAATALAALLTTAAFAQEAGDQPSGQMMQNQDGMSGGMMGGDMSGMEGMEGMMPMMEMMQKMGPMMEACTEMMQAKTDQMQAPGAEPQDG
ncbi:hypothetical protein [Jannaschia rubra]|uniref:Pentapeptide MXKDX repeat protein n=1 Tax=Jannaschia rubra TaxID=282197 RepID=A0A0M6XUX0_9RHOB|nr:hypothetical protein [Jannaschia rubra]CTQ34522.1 hypothetical protein JAN5088_03318 [Jannaschia rubra]